MRIEDSERFCLRSPRPAWTAKYRLSGEKAIGFARSEYGSPKQTSSMSSATVKGRPATHVEASANQDNKASNTLERTRPGAVGSLAASRDVFCAISFSVVTLW